MRLDLIFTVRDIYISSKLNLRTKFNRSRRSTEFKDILPWNISQIITKTIQIHKSIVISFTVKRGILFWVCRKVNGNWESNMIRIFQWKERYCRAITWVRVNKQIQKNRTVRVTVKDPNRKFKYLNSLGLSVSPE